MSDILICDALIQYENGRWASTPQFRIPQHVVEAALAAYDPTQPLRFHHRGRRLGVRYSHMRIEGTKPPCPYCKEDRVRTCGRNAARTKRRWQCLACWRTFTACVQMEQPETVSA